MCCTVYLGWRYYTVSGYLNYVSFFQCTINSTCQCIGVMVANVQLPLGVDSIANCTLVPGDVGQAAHRELRGSVISPEGRPSGALNLPVKS